ncbi:MAG TPA: hypothetical protein VFB07_05020 [Vicinamibacterales bacterium]|nr:hypothetical protein [Vicinamibacterales bacterium]
MLRPPNLGRTSAVNDTNVTPSVIPQDAFATISTPTSVFVDVPGRARSGVA